MTVSSLPTLPTDPITRNSTPTAFIAATTAFISAMPPFQVAMNASIVQFNSDFVLFNAGVTAAATSTSNAAAYSAQALGYSTSAQASAAAAQAAIGLPALKAGRSLYSPDGATVIWAPQDGVTQYVTSDYALLVGYCYDINTVSGAANLTLPANPVQDDWMKLTDTGLAGTNKFTVKRGGTNLATSPEDFNTTWVKTRITSTANTVITPAPDGTNTADLITEDTSVTTDHYISETMPALVAGAVHTFSVYAKAGTRSSIELSIPAACFIDAAARNASFNVSTGVVIAVTAGSTQAIQNVGNGWYRCSMTCPITLSASAAALIRMHNGATNTYTGTSATLYLWGAKLEVGPSAGFYDPVTVSTNLLTYSEQMDNAAWTKAAVTAAAGTFVAPDGTASADKVVETATTAAHTLSETSTVVAGSLLTASVYLKQGERSYAQLSIDDGTSNGLFANFNLTLGTIDTASAARGTGTVTAAASITNAGNGWWKCTVSGTIAPAATTARTLVSLSATTAAAFSSSYLGDITKGVYVWGAQLELGSVVSPYIQVVATSASRVSGIATRIMGKLEDMDIMANYWSRKLVYLNEFRGWVIR